jgi:threonine aldolase
MVRSAIKPKADWNPTTSLLCLENSINMGGGNYYRMDQVRSLTHTAHMYGLRTHLDGARLFHVLVETGDSPRDYGACFDSISICLSKGLGAPVGSLLISDRNTIDKARRIRKVFGGGMRQSGYLAAAGIYALDHHIERLRQDHDYARRSAAKLETVSWANEIYPVFTNIVIFSVPETTTSTAIVNQLAKHGIMCTAVNETLIRWVFHLDITADMMERIMDLPEHLS